VPNFCGTSDNLSYTVLYKVKCSYATFEITCFPRSVSFYSALVILFNVVLYLYFGRVKAREKLPDLWGPLAEDAQLFLIHLHKCGTIKSLICCVHHSVESSKTLDNLLYKLDMT